jgi:hypothetical protein
MPRRERYRLSRVAAEIHGIPVTSKLLSSAMGTGIDVHTIEMASKGLWT